MANPTTAGIVLNNLEATTDEQQITLDPNWLYAVLHNGIDTSGSPDTNVVYLATDAAVVADANEGADKAVLGYGAQLPIPPGKTTLRFRTGSGAPTFTLIPQRAMWHGR